MILVEILDDRGRTVGWLGERDTVVHGQLLARQLPDESVARLAMSRARANLVSASTAGRAQLPASFGFRAVEVGHHVPAPSDPLDAIGIELLTDLRPGSVLVVPAPHEAITGERIARLRDDVAERVGHSEFGLVFTGADEATTRLLSASVAMAEGDLVYVASPGVCPSCGSDQVTIHRDETAARSCSRCGHRWSQFHPGESAA